MGILRAALSWKLSILTLALLSVCTAVAQAQDKKSLEQTYPKASPMLVEEARKSALNMIALRRGDGVNPPLAPREAILNGVDAVWVDLFVFAVTDAIGASLSGEFKSVIEERQSWLLETTVTDRQIGSSSGSNAAVSLAQKPSMSKILGFAVERGALHQEKDGTNLTLSTTPYALGLLATGAKDSAENYQRIPVLNWLGGSVSFPLDESKDDGLNGADLEEISEFSVRITPWDRTTRARGYNELWHQEVGPALDRKFAALNSLAVDILNRVDEDDDPGGRRQALSESAQERVTESLASAFVPKLAGTVPADAASITQLREDIAKEILAQLDAEVAKRVINADGKPVAELLPPALVARIKSELLPALSAAEKDLDGATAAFKTLAKAWQEKKTGSLVYTQHRAEGGSDYSNLTLVYQGPLRFREFGFAEAVLNGGISFYHDASSSRNQETVRDYNVTFSLERSFDAPMHPGNAGADKITIALTGEFKRIEENNADIGTAQMNLSIPLVSGLAVPVALTYNSRTEERRGDEFRVNVGVNLDTDKLGSLLKLLR